MVMNLLFDCYLKMVLIFTKQMKAMKQHFIMQQRFVEYFFKRFLIPFPLYLTFFCENFLKLNIVFFFKKKE